METNAILASDKQMAQSVMDRLPERATTRQILNEIALLAALRKSEAQADAGLVMSHEEVMQRSATWISKSAGPKTPA